MPPGFCASAAVPPGIRLSRAAVNAPAGKLRAISDLPELPLPLWSALEPQIFPTPAVVHAVDRPRQIFYLIRAQDAHPGIARHPRQVWRVGSKTATTGTPTDPQPTCCDRLMAIKVL